MLAPPPPSPTVTFKNSIGVTSRIPVTNAPPPPVAIHDELPADPLPPLPPAPHIVSFTCAIFGGTCTDPEFVINTGCGNADTELVAVCDDVPVMEAVRVGVLV
jgi:hypothetical protein